MPFWQFSGEMEISCPGTALCVSGKLQENSRVLNTQGQLACPSQVSEVLKTDQLQLISWQIIMLRRQPRQGDGMGMCFPALGVLCVSFLSLYPPAGPSRFPILLAEYIGTA